MKEARIVCLTNQYRIRDLKLDLVKGQVKFLSEAQALGSLDLQGAKLAGVIEFQWVERSKVIRPPAPNPLPVVAKRRDPLPAPPPPPAPVQYQPPAPAPPVMDRRVLQDMVAESVKAQLADLRLAIVGDIQAVLSQISVAPAASPTVRGTVASDGARYEEDIPLFIPAVLFSGTAKAEIHVEAETSSEAGGLDEAQKALRTLRKRGKKDTET